MFMVSAVLTYLSTYSIFIVVVIPSISNLRIQTAGSRFAIHHIRYRYNKEAAIYSRFLGMDLSLSRKLKLLRAPKIIYMYLCISISWTYLSRILGDIHQEVEEPFLLNYTEE